MGAKTHLIVTAHAVPIFTARRSDRNGIDKALFRHIGTSATYVKRFSQRVFALTIDKFPKGLFPLILDGTGLKPLDALSFSFGCMRAGQWFSSGILLRNRMQQKPPKQTGLLPQDSRSRIEPQGIR